MGKDIRTQIAYTICCINAFAERYGLTAKQAFRYLKLHDGLEFLDECYEAEHQLSISDAVSDLAQVCRNNGGKL